MKLVILMYLEEDEGCVARLLEAQGVTTLSRLEMEGIGTGSPVGWSGRPLPYQSRMILTILPAAKADGLFEAVAGCRGVEDPRHPIRAVQLPVERAVSCLCEEPRG